MNCDAETSRYFAQVKIRLRRLGQMIPENDIWIAAHALQYSAKLATFDAHFSVVEGLQTESF
jgi:predicted nucleic acid-binding protein